MLAWLGLVSAILSLAAYRLSFGTVGVVFDTRPAGAALAILAVGLAVLAMRRRRDGAASAGRRIVGGAAVLLAILAGILIAHDLLFAYRTEVVRFLSGDVTLEGTLYLPRGADAPCPAVVILHGSGEQTRDEWGFYARLFAREGIAGLAYDKRGSGASGGDVTTATYDDLAADALAAVRYLEDRPEVDGRAIGLQGFSEGGWVAPLAAAGAESIAFVIVVSSTAESPAAQVRYEVGEKVRRAGFSDETAARARDLYAGLSRFERTGEGREELDVLLRQAASEPWFEAPGYLPEGLPPYEEVKKLRWFPAWRASMDFDAPSYWRSVSCPVLVLLGGDDPKMDGATAAASIREALLSGGNSEVTVRVFPNAGHGLVEWFLPGHLPPPRFPEDYPSLMVEWVRGSLEDPSGS